MAVGGQLQATDSWLAAHACRRLLPADPGGSGMISRSLLHTLSLTARRAAPPPRQTHAFSLTVRRPMTPPPRQMHNPSLTARRRKTPPPRQTHTLSPLARRPNTPLRHQTRAPSLTTRRRLMMTLP